MAKTSFGTTIALGFSAALAVGCTQFNTGANSASAPEIMQVPEGYLQTSKDLPVLTITTKNAAPVNSKDTYVTGHLSLDPKGLNSELALEADLKIKGRGNSTWGMPKKPYKIKFNEKQSLLGMPADKEFVLLANYSDKTLIRSTVAYELSRRVGLPYTVRSRSVEVVLNGISLGTYTAAESIKIAPDRVNIAALAPEVISGEELTGGYLLELDQRRDEPARFDTSRNVPYTVKEPEDAPAEQIQYIRSYMQEAEDVLYGANFSDPVNGYAKYIDVDSFINAFFVNEIYRNVDAANFSSIYFYKGRSGKLMMGPAWDFDLGGGNANYNDADKTAGWHVRKDSPWFSRLFQDPVFEAKVQARWKQLRATALFPILEYVDYQSNIVSQSQVQNFTVWPILNTYVWPNPVVTGSYEGEVTYFRTWLQTRMQWMDEQLIPADPYQPTVQRGLSSVH